MRGKISGSAPPPGGPKTEIVRVTSTEKQIFCCVSSAVFGQWIHWYGKRSHECTLEAGNCNGCQRGWPRKWKGYMHAMTGAPPRTVFVEITPACFELVAMLAPQEKSLRGVYLYLSKTKGGAKGRYLVEVLERRADESQLPEERDPRPILKFLWACKNQSGMNGVET
jgi:hypothetical protein